MSISKGRQESESSSINHNGDGRDNVVHYRIYGAVEEGQTSARRTPPLNVQKTRAPTYLFTILVGAIFVIFFAGTIFGYWLNGALNPGMHEQLRLKWAREEARKRSALTWDGLSPAEHCLRYATREYTARLTNVGLGLNPIEECYKKPLEIHGRQVLPVRCVDHAISGQVTGHWTVDFNEASCATFWSYIKDKGCVKEQRGVHRYEAPLENLQDGDNWREMCSTTPANINGVWYWNGPTSCVDWGKHGKWGIWLLEDRSCQ